MIATLKAQLARLGHPVGDLNSPLFDRQFELVVRDFQQSRGLVVDGVIGPGTFSELELARYRLGDRVLRFDPVRPMRGDDVAELQHRLSRLGMYTERVDFEFNIVTHNAVREMQTNLGLASDGIVGPRTVHALSSVYRDSSQGNLWALKERARVSASGQSLNGRVIVIESGTTRRDFPNRHIDEELLDAEVRLSGDIARRVEGRLTALGASIVQAPIDTPLLPDSLDAAAIISVNNDFADSQAPNGIATFYYGHSKNSTVVSPVGRSLAGLVHREIVARTELLDCGVHARTWHTLRITNTPKVHVFAGYLTNPTDRALLEQATVRDAVAEGITVAAQRLFLHEENDHDTGTLSLHDIKAMREKLGIGR